MTPEHLSTPDVEPSLRLAFWNRPGHDGVGEPRWAAALRGALRRRSYGGLVTQITTRGDGEARGRSGHDPEHALAAFEEASRFILVPRRMARGAARAGAAQRGNGHRIEARGAAMRASFLCMRIAGAHPDLGAARIARRLGVPPRSVQRVLAGTGTTAPAYIVGEPRVLAAQLLTAGRQAVGDIALRTGFADLSYSYRSFRKRYGTSPEHHGGVR